MAARARCERVRIAESECRRQQLQAYLQKKGKLEVPGHTDRYYLGDQTNRKIQQRSAPFKVGMGRGQKHNVPTTHSILKGPNNPACTNRIKSLAARNQVQRNSNTTENHPALTKTVPKCPQVMNADETTQSRQCMENIKPETSTCQFSHKLSNEEEKMKHTVGIAQIAGQSAGTALIKLFTEQANNTRVGRLKETASGKYSRAISIDNVARAAPGGAKLAAPSRGALSAAKPTAPSRGASGRNKPTSRAGESRGAPGSTKLAGVSKGAFSRARPTAPSRGAPGGAKPKAHSRGAPVGLIPAAPSRGAPGGAKPEAPSRGDSGGAKPVSMSGRPKPAAPSRRAPGGAKPAAPFKGAPGRAKPTVPSRGAPSGAKPVAPYRGAPSRPKFATLSRASPSGAKLAGRFGGTLVRAKSGENRGGPARGKPASAAVKSMGRLTIPKEPSKAKMGKTCGTFGKTEQKFESDNTGKSACHVSPLIGPNSVASCSATIWKPFTKSTQNLYLVLGSPPRSIRKSKGAVQNLMGSTISAMSTVKHRDDQSSITKTFKGKDERRKQLEEWLASKGKTYKRPPMPTPLKRVKSVKKNLERSFLDAMEEEKTLAVRVEHMLDNCMKLLERGSPPEQVSEALQNVPEGEKFAKFWICQARLLELTDTMEAVIALFEQAVHNGAEPVEELRSALVEAIMRNSNSYKACTEKEDVKTGGCEESDVATPRSTVVKFLCGKTDGHGSSVIKYRVTATPQVLGTNEHQNRVQSAGQQGLKYLTPVRRSTRIEHVSVSHPVVLREHDHCVTSLNELLTEEGDETFLYKENRALLAE